MTDVKALLFDVFGTLVDWRTSIINQMMHYVSRTNGGISAPVDTDWEAVALDWRGFYQPSMEAVRSGMREFVILDVLHRESLIKTLEKHRITGLTDAQLNDMTMLWHTLDPWPDAPEGLLTLRKHYTLAAVSNGNTELLKHLSTHAQLGWHVALGAEPSRTYKPQSHCYLYSAALLGLDPSQCMMVAAHNSDLQAARDLGFSTAYINRPTEYGIHQSTDTGPESDWNYSVDSLLELASALSRESSAQQDGAL